MAALTAFDIVVLLMIGLAAAAGVARGFVTELLSLLAWVGAYFAVRLLYPVAKPFAVELTNTPAAGSILAFALIFIIAFVAFRAVAGALGSRTRNSIVGPVDRLAGLGFGAFKGLLGAAVIYLVLTMGGDVLDPGEPRPEWLAEAKTAPLLARTSRAMVDWVEERRGTIGKPDTAEAEAQGYDKADRSALEKLLDGAAR